MESENLQAIYCENVGEYKVNCDIFDELCIERFYKNHLKSQTHSKNIRQKI